MRVFPRPVRPSVAIADLRAFLKTRTPHQWTFAALSVTIPCFFIAMFLVDAIEEEYRPPEIIWVKNFDPNRSDAQIRADQERDTAERKKQEAAEQAELKRRRKPFQEIDRKLRDWGL
jgi:hypothetical protein